MEPRLRVVAKDRATLNSTLLREWLNRAGFKVRSGWGGDSSPEDVFFTTPDVGTHAELPTLALGDGPVEALTGFRLPTLKVRGSILPRLDGGWLVAGLDPGVCGHGSDELKPFFGVDAQRALYTATPIIPDMHFLQSPSRLPLNPATGQLVSVDIEGSGENVKLTGAAWEEAQGNVFPWSDELRLWLIHLFETTVPCAHNGVYDFPELEQAGVPRPKEWVDTINLAALYDPDQRMGLEPQVLIHVPGSTTWKGLIDHEQGPHYEGAKVKEYRRLWVAILARLDRPVPSGGLEWFQFYNNLDTVWGLTLANHLIRKAKAQDRYAYYTEVMQPLQPILMDMGARGLPVDVVRLGQHRAEALKKQSAARAKIQVLGEHTMQIKATEISIKIKALEFEREQARSNGERKFSKSEELTKLRTKLKSASTFNPDSPAHLAAILYDHFGLPIIKTDKGGRSVKEAATDDLLSRVTRGTAKVKQGTKEEALEVLTGVQEYNSETHRLDTFLQPPVEYRDGWNYIPTSYSQHRANTGRLSSGLDDSDLSKGRKLKKKAQVQNWPKDIRDMVVPPPGHVCVGGDWTGFQLALFLYFAEEVERDGFHGALLERMMAGEFDPHAYLACVANGVEDGTIGKEDERRKQAKGYTFELLFEGSGRTTARKIGHPDKVGVMMYDAHELAFRKAKWRDNLMAQVKRKHYIQTVLGWRRWFWSWTPKASEVTATYIQATEADVFKWVAVTADSKKPRDWHWLTFTHDFCGLWVPAKQAEDAKMWLHGQMNKPIPWLGGRSWLASVKVGQNWAEVS